MKYMSVYYIAPENIKNTIKRFKEADPKPGAGAKLLGRWHEVGTGKGFALLEADDPVALTRFLVQWADLVDQKVVPVVDDGELSKAL